MVGMDQDNVVLAPWTTAEVPRQRHDTRGNESEWKANAESSSTSDTVNTLSNLYPTATSLYLSRTTNQQSDTPQPGASPISIKSWSKRFPISGSSGQ